MWLVNQLEQSHAREWGQLLKHPSEWLLTRSGRWDFAPRLPFLILSKSLLWLCSSEFPLAKAGDSLLSRPNFTTPPEIFHPTRVPIQFWALADQTSNLLHWQRDIYNTQKNSHCEEIKATPAASFNSATNVRKWESRPIEIRDFFRSYKNWY